MMDYNVPNGFRDDMFAHTNASYPYLKGCLYGRGHMTYHVLVKFTSQNKC